MTGDLFLFDHEIRRSGYGLIAGIDEAGRGPLAGPVVAAAVILEEGHVIAGLRDSKKLTERQRAVLYREIVSSARSVGLGIVEAEEIDRLNILKATRKAMLNAIRNLTEEPHLLLIDAVTLEECKTGQKALIKGDSRSASIAAASVVAKFVRDRLMLYYHDLYPVYGFDRHKGYGTRLHREMLRRYGPCPIHRRSFAPVAELELPIGDT